MSVKKLNIKDIVASGVRTRADGSNRSGSHLGGVVGEMTQGLADRLEALEEKYGGSFPTKKISTSSLHRGPFANRLPYAFDEVADPKFASLMQAIKAQGGNVAPIFVRPVVGKDTYELVYGERRWRACQKLGLDVLAIIGEIDDEEAALLQHHENHNRKDVSVLESAYQVCSWASAIGYGQHDEFAKRLDMSPPHVSNLKLIGQIPMALALAHPDVSKITFRQARELAVLHRDQPEILADRVDKVSTRKPIPSPGEVTSFLVTGSWTKGEKATTSVSKVGIKNGKLTLDFESVQEPTAFLRSLRKLALKHGLDVEGSL